MGRHFDRGLMVPLLVVRGEGPNVGPGSIDIFSKLAEERIIFLHEELDTNVASNLIAALLYLDNQDPSREITIYINSVGGDLDSLFGIYDIFQSIKAPIKTIAVGKAYSAAAVLLAAGTKGQRFICPHAQVMIHHIQISEMEGSKREVEAQVQRLDSENQTLVEMLARHTGQPMTVVDADCQEDKYFQAQEAIEYGLVDHILPTSKKLPRLRKRRKAK